MHNNMAHNNTTLDNRGSKAELIAMDGLDSLEENSKDRQFVTALARGLEVLRCFKPRDRHLGNQDEDSRNRTSTHAEHPSESGSCLPGAGTV